MLKKLYNIINHVSVFENSKKINKPLSENNDIMIESTFWSTEINF